MENNKIGAKLIYDGIELLLKGWKILGLDKQAPDEFKKLVNQRKTIGDQNGWS